MTDVYPTQVSEEPQARPGAIYTPEAEPDRIDRELPFYPASRGLALREVFDDAQITDRLLGFVQADQERAFSDDMRTVFGEEARPRLTAEEANTAYGVEGRLSFDEAVDPSIAAWRHGQARRSLFRDEVVANADLSWWETLGTSFAGSLLDPAGLPLWLAPELAAGRALKAGAAASRLRALPGVVRGAITGGVEGVAGGVLYEGANLWLHHEAADDYDFGQASANVLLGGLLGAGLGGVGGWWEGRGRAPRVPAEIEALTEPARMGAFVDGFDAMLEDRPVDLTPVLARETAQREAASAADGRFDIQYGDDPDAPSFWVRPDDALAMRQGLDDDDFLFGWVGKTELKIERANLAPDRRGRGLGVGMYERAAREAEARQLDLVSDIEVSEDAQRVWSSLERRGYRVERNPDVKKVAGGLASQNGRPVFRIAAGENAVSLKVESLPGGLTTKAKAPARTMGDDMSAWYASAAPDGDRAGHPMKALYGEEPADRGPSPFEWHPSYGTPEHWAEFQRTNTNLATPARYKTLYGVAPPKAAKTPKGAAPSAPKGEPYADPEIAALAADTEAMLAREGLEVSAEALDPQTVADAVAAGAFCLRAST